MNTMNVAKITTVIIRYFLIYLCLKFKLCISKIKSMFNKMLTIQNKLISDLFTY